MDGLFDDVGQETEPLVPAAGDLPPECPTTLEPESPKAAVEPASEQLSHATQPSASSKNAEQLAAVAARTKAQDEATARKEEETITAAKKYLADKTQEYEEATKAAKEACMAHQKEYEDKKRQFQNSGAVWNSVNLLLDLEKPNPFSKNTDVMRRVLVNLKSDSPE